MLRIILIFLISILVGLIVLIFPIYSPAILIVLLINAIIFLAPKYFILFWLIIAGFSNAIQFHEGMTSYGAMNLIFLPSLILKIIIDYRKEIFQFPIIKFYLAFLFIYFISIWYSPEPHFMCFRKYWAFVIPLMMSTLITGAFKNNGIIKKYIKLTLLFIAFLSILSTAMFMSGRWKESTSILDRAGGVFGGANFYAMFLNFQFGISLTLAIFLKEKKDKIFYYIISFILCLSIVPTFSKGAYITCFLIFFGLSVLAIPLKRQVSHIFIAIGFISVLVIFGMTFFHTTILHRFSNQDTLIWRINLWKNLMSNVMRSPIWGHGYLSYFQITGDVLGVNGGFAPHSQYLEILLDVGLIGLTTFLGTYLGMIYYAFRAYSISKDNFIKAISLGFIISMVATLFHSFTEVAFYIPMLNLYLWFYFGFLVALVNIEKKNSLQVYANK